MKWRGLEVSCLPLQSFQGEYKKSQYFNTSPLCKDYASVPPVVVLLGSWGEGGGGEEEKRLKKETGEGLQDLGGMRDQPRT